MKYSVCVDAIYLFRDEDVYQGIEQLARTGVKNMEFWTWWDKDLGKLLQLKEKYDLTYTGICTRFISMLDEKCRDEYLDGLKETVEVCKKLGIKSIVTKPLDKNNRPFEEQYSAMVGLLKEAADILEHTDITLQLEPVSYMEAPYTFLGDSTLGFMIVKQVNSPHVKLLYDIYHMQLDEGDVLRRMLANLEYIGHIHSAGIDDRNELGLGELNYRYIVNKLEEAGYRNYFGLEYFPKYDPAEGIRKIVIDHNFEVEEA